MVDLCRAEGTTLHGALCASLLKAVARQLQLHEGSEAPVDLGCFSPVSVREELESQIARDEVGFYVSAATTYHRVGAEQPLWELAREVRQQLRQMKQRDEFCAMVKLREYLAPRRSLADPLRITGSAALSAVGVTNLKRLDISTRFGPLELERLHFALASQSFGTTPMLAVSTLEGRIQLNLTYTESLVSEKLARTLLEQVVAELHARTGVPRGLQRAIAA
jgi:hypothetical protein